MASASARRMSVDGNSTSAASTPQATAHRDSLTSEMSYFADTSPVTDLNPTSSLFGVRFASDQSSHRASTVSLAHVPLYRRYDPHLQQECPFGDPDHYQFLHSIADRMRSTTPSTALQSSRNQSLHQRQSYDISLGGRGVGRGSAGIADNQRRRPSSGEHSNTQLLEDTIRCRTIDVGGGVQSPPRDSSLYQRKYAAPLHDLNETLALSPIPVNRPSNISGAFTRSMQDFDAYAMSPSEKVPTAKPTPPEISKSKYQVASSGQAMPHPSPALRRTTLPSSETDLVDINSPLPFAPHSYYASSYATVKQRDRLILRKKAHDGEEEGASRLDVERSPISDSPAKVLLRQRAVDSKVTAPTNVTREISTVYFDGQLQHFMELDKVRRRQDRDKRRQMRQAFKEERRRELMMAALGQFAYEDSHVNVTLSPISNANDTVMDGSSSPCSDGSDDGPVDSGERHGGAADQSASLDRMDGNTRGRRRGVQEGEEEFHELLVPLDEATRRAKERAVRQDDEEKARRAAHSKMTDHRTFGSSPLDNCTDRDGGAASSTKVQKPPSLSDAEAALLQRRSAHVLGALDVAYDRDASCLYSAAMSNQLSTGPQANYHSALQQPAVPSSKDDRSCGVVYPSLNAVCDSRWPSLSSGVVFSLEGGYSTGQLGGKGEADNSTAAEDVGQKPVPPLSPILKPTSTQLEGHDSTRSLLRDKSRSASPQSQVLEDAPPPLPQGQSKVVRVVEGTDGGNDGNLGLRRKQTQMNLFGKQPTSLKKPPFGNNNEVNGKNSHAAPSSASPPVKPHEPTYITITLPPSINASSLEDKKERSAKIELPESTHAAEAIADTFIREQGLNPETVRKPLIDFLLYSTAHALMSHAEGGMGAAATASDSRKRTPSLVPRCATLPNPQVRRTELALKEKQQEEERAKSAKKSSVVSAGSRKLIERMLAEERAEDGGMQRRASMALPAHLRLHPQVHEDALQNYYAQHGRLPSSAHPMRAHHGPPSQTAAGRLTEGGSSTTPRRAPTGDRLHAQAKDRRDRLAAKSRQASRERAAAEMQGVTLRPRITAAGRSAAPKYSTSPAISNQPSPEAAALEVPSEDTLTATQRRQFAIANVTFGDVHLEDSSDSSNHAAADGPTPSTLVASPSAQKAVSPPPHRPTTRGRSNAVSKKGVAASGAIRDQPTVTKMDPERAVQKPRLRANTATPKNPHAPPPTINNPPPHDVGSRLYDLRDTAKERRDSLRNYHSTVDPTTGQKLFQPNLSYR